MVSRVLILILACVLTGCVQSTKEVDYANQKELSSGGVLVGRLGGRELRRYKVSTDGGATHFVYAVEGLPSTTTTEPRGKAGDQVTVFVDGVPYVPATPAQVDPPAEPAKTE